MAQITFNGVTKRYDDGTEAVKRLDLPIDDGDFAILVGPSGCGKTTALRMVAGLEEVSDGELIIDGEVVNDREPKKRDVAMVFQNYALYPHMTVRQNMAYSLKLHKVSKTEIGRRIVEAADLLDLTPQLERRPGQLSGGQRQRVAMGRAIVREPKAFLMDEPLSNLDAKLRVEMRAMLSRLQHRLQTTTVYVTHDQTEAMTLGDRVAVMRLGELQQYDTPDVLYREPVNIFVAGFIGSPAMNFFPGTVDGGHVITPLGPLPLFDALRRRLHRAGVSNPVVVGIRPEAFELADVATRYGLTDGSTFGAPVQLVEALGAENYIHFGWQGERVRSQQLDELEADAGSSDAVAADQERAVARVNGTVRPRVGDTVELWVDHADVKLFDRTTGLTV